MDKPIIEEQRKTKWYKGMPAPNTKGRPRKHPLPSAEEIAAQTKKRLAKIRAIRLKREREIVPLKYYNKHNLVWSKRRDDKAIVLAWIQPEGEEEIVQSILVDRSQVDNVTKQTLLDEFYQNKVKNSLFLRQKSPALQSFNDDKNTQ